MLLLLLLGCCSRRPPETPEGAPAQPPPPALAANRAPPPAHTLRPVPPLLPPPWRPPWRPQQSFKSPEEAYTRAHREDRNEARTAETAGQKGGNGRLRVPRARVAVVAAAGTGMAAWRRAGAAAGRVREASEGREKGGIPEVEARKSDEGQTGGPEAAGGARDRCPDPPG
jgi:hypothetical protein